MVEKRKERILGFIVLLLTAIFCIVFGGEWGLIFGICIVFLLLIVVTIDVRAANKN